MEILKNHKKKIIFVLVLISVSAFLIRKPADISGKIEWGVAFSKFFSESIDLDWRETYLAILDDLKPKNLRLPIYWPEIESEIGKYTFDDYDWMIEEAKKRDVKLILVIGRRLPRWPECHIPPWAENLSEEDQQTKILDLISRIVSRYQNNKNVYAWQVENEPFLLFGECPKLDVDFLDREIEIVRSLDKNRPIIVTDSGELSIWLRAAKRADIFGTTMYRIVWSDTLGYIKYPLPPKFFWLKANITRLFYPNKPIIVSELQAETWGPKMVYETPLEKQLISMNLEQFRENIEYAKTVGFQKNYLWGAEWWYWLKMKHNQDDIWEEAKKLWQ